MQRLGFKKSALLVFVLIVIGSLFWTFNRSPAEEFGVTEEGLEYELGVVSVFWELESINMTFKEKQEIIYEIDSNLVIHDNSDELGFNMVDVPAGEEKEYIELLTQHHLIEDARKHVFFRPEHR